MIFNVALVSVIHQSESVIYTHISIHTVSLHTHVFFEDHSIFVTSLELAKVYFRASERLNAKLQS